MPGIQVTRTVRWLLIINISAFLIQLIGDTFFGAHLLETFGLIPYLFYEKMHLWQIVTYQFMHADLFHILFNMLILWMIGSELEAKWGQYFFIKYYFISGIAAGLFYLAVQAFFRGSQAAYLPLVGSSGAIYGLLVAYGIIFSERMMLFMMIFPMKAKHFVLVLAAIEFISTVFYARSGIANAAHLGGMLVGFGYLFLHAYLRVQGKRKKLLGGKKGKMRFRKSHLRLVVNNELFREFDDDEDAEGGTPTVH